MASLEQRPSASASWATTSGILKPRQQQKDTVLSPSVVNLAAGWGAGTAEALTCHPLDTTKVKMQMAKKSAASAHTQFKPTFARTLIRIVQTEGPVGLYSGLSSVVMFMGPKIALRFTAFESFKKHLAGPDGKLSSAAVLSAGLGAGVVEAVAVVTPMEVIKIKLQSGELLNGQPKYKSMPQTISTVLRESGIKGLYNGLAMTATRQATNQAAIFSTYTYLKAQLQKQHGDSGVPGWKVSAIGFLSGVAAPCTNTPIDTIKTRLQRSTPVAGQSEFQRARIILADIVRHEGVGALYRGCLPRVLRAGPAQAVTFTVYENIKALLTSQRHL